ncbi:hypothetical protein ACQP2E_27655 [Actinoplanes sp. CA-015351]|uniref:hypothetical protein n=1 Tax=Actinoplanes sp. CA-015351 TaxID=3239897 RepID=UPI003D96A920
MTVGNVRYRDVLATCPGGASPWEFRSSVMASALESLILALSYDLETLQGAVGVVGSQAMDEAIQAQGQAAALGVDEIAVMLEAVKDHIAEATSFVGEAAAKIEMARSIAASLPT